MHAGSFLVTTLHNRRHDVFAVNLLHGGRRSPFRGLKCLSNRKRNTSAAVRHLTWFCVVTALAHLLLSGNIWGDKHLCFLSWQSNENIDTRLLRESGIDLLIRLLDGSPSLRTRSWKRNTTAITHQLSSLCVVQMGYIVYLWMEKKHLSIFSFTL